MAKPGLYLIGKSAEKYCRTLSEAFELYVQSEIPDVDGFLTTHGSEIAAIGTNGHDGVPANLHDRCPNLKIISCYGAGYDEIDAKTAHEHGVVVTHTPDVLNDEVANTALMLLLATSRDLINNHDHVRSGSWETEGQPGLAVSIAGKTVGIVGLGRIGLAIATKLQAFGVDIVYHSRNARDDVDFTYYSDLAKMAEDCWALIIATPGGSSTDKLVNEPVMQALGTDGILINVARGSVVDEEAMIRLLSDGRLGKAGLDVFANEPCVPVALRSMSNVVHTPHIGSATVETRDAMGKLMVDNLSQFMETGVAVSPVPECRNK
ncbi:MAG: 2-hydroxyacid dehydrogenase [Pseudomonadota bacterium]